MALLLPGDDSKKKSTSKSLKLITPLAPVTPSVDSLEFAKGQIDKYTKLANGKPFDASNPNIPASRNKDLHAAVKYLTGHITKYQKEADELHARKLSEQSEESRGNYPGLTAQDLDEVTEGKGKEYLEHVKTYSKYRDLTNKGKTALEEKAPKSVTIGPSSFGPSSTEGTIDYYNPDKGAATLKKRTQIPIVR